MCSAMTMMSVEEGECDCAENGKADPVEDTIESQWKIHTTTLTNHMYSADIDSIKVGASVDDEGQPEIRPCPNMVNLEDDGQKCDQGVAYVWGDIP